jgi:Fe-S cluster biogenesis protein NfuA
VPEQQWQAAGARIESLIVASASAGPVAHHRAEELVRLVADLYGGALERLLDLLHEHGALTDEVIDAVAGDDLVAGLLLVHGLHPYDVDTRIERALAGHDAELLGVTADGVARLRMPGGCASSSAAKRSAVEAAIEEVAPEVTAIEVDEAVPADAAAVIPVSALFTRVGGAARATT